jgi:SPP1 family predicted phage head-tail adaptor
MIPQRAGYLDTRVTLERRNETDDEVGDPVPAWTQYAQVWAHMAPTSGNEVFIDGQIHAQRMTRFSIRYRDDVLPTDRIMVGDVPYNIEAVLARELRLDELTLIASDGLNNG